MYIGQCHSYCVLSLYPWFEIVTVHHVGTLFLSFFQLQLSILNISYQCLHTTLPCLLCVFNTTWLFEQYGECLIRSRNCSHFASTWVHPRFWWGSCCFCVVLNCFLCLCSVSRDCSFLNTRHVLSLFAFASLSWFYVSNFPWYNLTWLLGALLIVREVAILM